MAIESNLEDKPKRPPKFKQSGVLLVDKPKEWTSHDVVNFVRRRFNVPKVGHCGTLDPAATGLLVLVIGRFTKLSAHFSGEDKTYDATMLLGTETDSQDMDGKVTATGDYSAVTREMVLEVMGGFLGEQKQMPPMVSAIKKDGEKLYDLARRGIEVERDPKDIVIRSLEVASVELPFVKFNVCCSKGTYVRTICADAGALLGCGGVLHDLRRTHSGEFSIDDAVTVDAMREWTHEDLTARVEEYLFKTLSRMEKLSGF